MSKTNAWIEWIKNYSNKELAERKTWYGNVAEDYYRVRPRYPQEILNRVIELSQLKSSAKILELGCGPGIATVPLAQLGFSLVSLEPNLEAANLAKQHCVEYPNVTVINTTFEEWDGERESFDAVIATTSWHWIRSEIAYPKTYEVLNEQGHLILLWNTPPQLSYEQYQPLEPIYQALVPTMPIPARYETLENQQSNFQYFGQEILGSGYFDSLSCDCKAYPLVYTIADYLALLSTLSPYIALEPETRRQLFSELAIKLLQTGSDRLDLTYLSAFHVAQKKAFG
ncbi:MAG: class I SAM-dependent methyltransferase [Snowella sp.]|nr:class I SAM-dependent methyltransferase [Snowella sp.]